MSYLDQLEKIGFENRPPLPTAKTDKSPSVSNVSDQGRQFSESAPPSVSNVSNQGGQFSESRIPSKVNRAFNRAIHPLDAESLAEQKIHWVLSCCPEIGLTVGELKEWYRDDLTEIAGLSLEHTYRLIADYWSWKR